MSKFILLFCCVIACIFAQTINHPNFPQPAKKCGFCIPLFLYCDTKLGICRANDLAIWLGVPGLIIFGIIIYVLRIIRKRERDNIQLGLIGAGLINGNPPTYQTF